MTDKAVMPAVGSQAVAAMETLDGTTLAHMFETAGGWMERHVPHINALNVFPVPDGDTGTNMMLTVQSGLKELANQSSDRNSVSEVANRFARGALLGARGNSGVILSQILRGFADGLTGKKVATSADLVEAMQQATTKAYQSLTNPVEGTMLTVIREAAEAAQQSYEAGETNITNLMQVIVQAAKQAELNTPNLLPVLKEAGVTDSGGHGLWVFFDGAWRHLRGEKIAISLEMRAIMDGVGHPQADNVTQDGPWGYDIQFLIKARLNEPLDVMAIREYISSIGDCALVVGDEKLVKVHVHCLNPGPAITYGADQGRISDVVVEDMDEQAEQFLQDEPGGGSSGIVHTMPSVPPLALNAIHSAKSTDQVTGIGIVAVVPGEGLQQVFRSLGVSQIIDGGQTMNPSTQDLLEAVEASDADTIIILPNNKNIILSARQVPDLTSKNVYLLPTYTIPQGISSLMAFNYSGDVEDNLVFMEDAMNYVQTGEVTTSIRTTTIDGVSVVEGDFIGLLNDKLVVADKSPELVIRAMLERLDLSEYEIITFYYGHTVIEQDAQNLIELLANDYQELEIQVILGGQPHYHYIFSVE